MHKSFVAVLVRVGLSRGHILLVLMAVVLIVHVRVLVLDQLVLMRMLVPLS
jgi:hypothetical protein